MIKSNRLSGRLTKLTSKNDGVINANEYRLSILAADQDRDYEAREDESQIVNFRQVTSALSLSLPLSLFLIECANSLYLIAGYVYINVKPFQHNDTATDDRLPRSRSDRSMADREESYFDDLNSISRCTSV